MNHRSAHCGPARGFTLIEVVVTIFVVSLLVYASASIASTFMLTRSAEYQGVASRIASSKLNELRSGRYASLPGNGSFSDNELTTLPQGAGDITVAILNAKTKQVTVTVSWFDKTLRSVPMTTLITETGGL